MSPLVSQFPATVARTVRAQIALSRHCRPWLCCSLGMVESSPRTPRLLVHLLPLPVEESGALGMGSEASYHPE